MSKTFTYTFLVPAGGNIIVTTNDDAQAIPNDNFQGFAITNVSGTFAGSQITGLYGSSGKFEVDPSTDFQDNAIFVNAAEGSGGSYDGIDTFGLSFTLSNHNIINLYRVKGQDAFVYDVIDANNNVIQGSQPVALTATNYSTAVCYAGGTRIRVLRDGALADVAVEDLAVGDLAVTASGAPRAIRWLGSFDVDCAGHPDPRRVCPVRIAAHAFGPDRPARDLRVSPDHAVCVDLLGEVLVPAHAFLNGATVTQDRDDAVTYWHVELEGGHDILLAENMPAESYLDCGNRGFFAGEALSMDPGLDAAGSCRERTTDPVLLAALRARLRRQALALGWRLDAADGDGPDLGGLRLLVDGVPVLPDTDGLAARFLLPTEARDVWLVSAASVPWDVSDTTDGRRLGLCLRTLSLTDGLGPDRAIALDDPRLAAGFHPAEPGCRWTDGRARLDPALWAGCRGHLFLRLELARPCLPAWRAPAKSGTALRVA